MYVIVLEGVSEIPNSDGVPTGAECRNERSSHLSNAQTTPVCKLFPNFNDELFGSERLRLDNLFCLWWVCSKLNSPNILVQDCFMSVFANKVPCSFSGKKLGFTFCCDVEGWYFHFISKVVPVWDSIVWKVLVCADVLQNYRVRRINRLSMTILSAAGACLDAPDSVKRLLCGQRYFLLTRKSREDWRRFGLTS